MAERQVLLSNLAGLVGADLTPAYRAVKSGQVGSWFWCPLELVFISVIEALKLMLLNMTLL